MSLMLKPLVPAARTPPTTPLHRTLIDFVIVSVPKPPGSRQLISPPVAVLEIAPANVLHGAVRLHGLASSPTPETQVRVACACAGAAFRPKTRMPPTIAPSSDPNFLISILPDQFTASKHESGTASWLPETGGDRISRYFSHGSSKSVVEITSAFEMMS